MDTEELVLIAEDNPDDAVLLKRAIQKAGIKAAIRIVVDGEQLLSYLTGSPPYEDGKAHPRPNLIIVDLKMPRKGGFEVLQWLMENPEYAVVPTIVMSASMLDEDVRRAYRLGANSYFVKPGSFDDLVRSMKAIREYWENAVRVPPQKLGERKQGR